MIAWHWGVRWMWIAVRTELEVWDTYLTRSVETVRICRFVRSIGFGIVSTLSGILLNKIKRVFILGCFANWQIWNGCNLETSIMRRMGNFKTFALNNDKLTGVVLFYPNFSEILPQLWVSTWCINNKYLKTISFNLKAVIKKFTSIQIPNHSVKFKFYCLNRSKHDLNVHIVFEALYGEVSIYRLKI